MNVRILFVAGAVLLGIFAGAATRMAVTGGSPAANAQPQDLRAGNFKLGDKLPDFAWTDREGRQRRLAELLDGKRFVVINFHHPDCPCALSCGRLINEMMDSGYSEDVAVIGFQSFDLDNERVMAALAAQEKDRQIAYPVYFDKDGAVRRMFGAARTPEMWVLDREGRVAFYGAPENTLFAGAPGHRYLLREAIDALRAGRQPEIRRYDPIGCPMP